MQVFVEAFVDSVASEARTTGDDGSEPTISREDQDAYMFSLINMDERAQRTRRLLEETVFVPTLDLEAPSYLEGMTLPHNVRVWCEHEARKRAESNRLSGVSNEVSASIDDLLSRSPDRELARPLSLDYLAELVQTTPNFKAVVSDLLQQAALSIKAGPAPVFDPVLLLGPPGVGKTYFAHRLAEALNTQAHLVPMGILSHAGVLCGSDASWKGARMGQVTRALIESYFANPVIILDEIDKATFNSSVATYPPASAALYSLLEPETAKAYMDEFFMLHFNAAHVTWILTANEASCIPEPLLSRMRVYEIPAIDPEDMPPVIDAVYQGVLKRYHADFFESLPPETVSALKGASPRDLRLMIADGVGRANHEQRTVLLPEDVLATKLRPAARSIGFV